MRRTSLFPRALSHRIIPSHIRTVKPLPERCATRYLYSSSLPTQTPCQNIPAKTKPRRVALNYLQRSFLHSKVPASSTTARKIARKEPQPAKPTKTSTQGVISFPSVNVMTLNIPLPDHQETMFSIKTHVPIGMLLSNIMDEHPWVVDAAVYEPDDAGKLGYRWASATCIDDVVREAVRGAQKGFILVLNGEHHISIQIPPFEERANSLIQQLKSKEEEYSQMFNIKEECDGKAAKTSRKVNYAGLAFLVGQWGILARMTYWEFSWDVMEPICYFLTSGNAIVGYIFYIFFKKEFTYENLHDVNFTKQQVTLYEKAALDVRRYYELKGEIQARKEELEKIKSEYD